jgi:ribosome biogenesis GTPase
MPAGSVVEYHREYCWVELDDGREVIAKPRGRLELDEQAFAQQICVGDRVEVEEAEPGHHVIEQIKERETWLLRRNVQGSFRRKPQCVVANADLLAVVIAPKPDLRVNVADRYFIAALLGGLRPILVLNKIDLDPSLKEHIDIAAFRRLGHSVHLTNALSGEGLEGLVAEIAGSFTAFCGHSGVGKSTILAKLTGLPLKIGAVTGKSGKGRQTTTTARTYKLPAGGEVVDTPGVREFAVASLERLDVFDYFKDIAAMTLNCQFRDCRHDTEPGCAVRAAIEAGELSSARLRSFQSMLDEAARKEWASDRELES